MCSYSIGSGAATAVLLPRQAGLCVECAAEVSQVSPQAGKVGLQLQLLQLLLQLLLLVLLDLLQQQLLHLLHNLQELLIDLVTVRLRAADSLLHGDGRLCAGLLRLHKLSMGVFQRLVLGHGCGQLRNVATLCVAACACMQEPMECCKFDIIVDSCACCWPHTLYRLLVLHSCERQLSLLLVGNVC